MIIIFFIMIFIALAFLCGPLLKKSSMPRRVSTICAIVITIVVPVGSLLLYMYLGAPELVK